MHESAAKSSFYRSTLEVVSHVTQVTLLVRDSTSESNCLSMDPRLCLLLKKLPSLWSQEETRSHWFYSILSYCDARGTMIQAHKGPVDVFSSRTDCPEELPLRLHVHKAPTSLKCAIFLNSNLYCHLIMSLYQTPFSMHFHSGREVHFNCSFCRKALWIYLKSIMLCYVDMFLLIYLKLDKSLMCYG